LGKKKPDHQSRKVPKENSKSSRYGRIWKKGASERAKLLGSLNSLRGGLYFWGLRGGILNTPNKSSKHYGWKGSKMEKRGGKWVKHKVFRQGMETWITIKSIYVPINGGKGGKAKDKTLMKKTVSFQKGTRAEGEKFVGGGGWQSTQGVSWHPWEEWRGTIARFAYMGIGGELNMACPRPIFSLSNRKGGDRWEVAFHFAQLQLS